MTNKDEDQVLKERLGVGGLDVRLRGLEDLIRHRGVTERQTDTKIKNDERHRRVSEDLARWRNRIAEKNAATGERRTDIYKQSVDQQADAALDRQMNHEDTYGLNLAGKQDKLNKLRSDLEYAKANAGAKDPNGNPLFPPQYVQSLQNRVDDLANNLTGVQKKHESRSPRQSTPPVRTITRADYDARVKQHGQARVDEQLKKLGISVQ